MFVVATACAVGALAAEPFDYALRAHTVAEGVQPARTAYALARRVGVEKYSRPSIMIGLTCIDELALASPV